MRKKSPILKTRDVKLVTCNATPKKPKIRSGVEMVAWIIGIIVGLIVIKQTLFNNKSVVSNENIDSVKNEDSNGILDTSDMNKVSNYIKKQDRQDSIFPNNNQNISAIKRQASETDVSLILDSVPRKYFISINYQNGFESAKYAYSLSEKLIALGYKNMGYIIDSVPIFDNKKRFLLIKHLDTAFIYIRRVE